MNSKKKTIIIAIPVYIIVGLILTFSLSNMASEHQNRISEFENHESVLDWNLIVMIILIMYFIGGIGIIIFWTFYAGIKK